MIDPFDALTRALVTHAPTAPAFAFAAGLLSSLGPCLTTRLAAIGGLVAGTTPARRVGLVAAFSGGILGASAAITCSAALLRHVVTASSLVYGIVAVAFGWYGLRALLRCDSHAHRPVLSGRSAGWAFLSGGALGMIASPCCTPVIASIAGLTMLDGGRWTALVTSAAFSIGHVSPVLALGMSATRLPPRTSDGFARCATVVTGGVLLSLGGYYAMLA